MKLRGFLFMILAYCVVSIPVAAQVVFQNSDGMLSSQGGNGSSSIGQTTLTLSDSVLIEVGGLTAYGISSAPGSDLGSLTFTTGTLASGSITGGATFSAGGTFTITYQNGTIFTGSFVNPAPGQAAGTWTNTGNGLFYDFTGTVNGKLMVPGYAAATVMGATIQLSNIPANLVATGSGYTLKDSGGTTSFGLPAGGLTPVPEPGTLSLLGGGLVSLGLIARRRKSKSSESA